MRPAGVQRIAEIFHDQLARGLHPGAQMVVLRHGQVVLDLAAGLADVRRGLRVTPATPFLAWSCGKALTGICMHTLIERGQVELDAPVARYWPEFGGRGKETATIRHAFLHQAGIPRRGIYRQYLLWPNWERVTASVARLPAEFAPGALSQYHLVNYGFILGKVIERVTGLRPDEYMRRTLFEPLGMGDSWLGLPANQRERAARLYHDRSEQWQAATAFSPWRIRGALMPAATLHTNARALATFYQMLLNGGQYAGRRIVRPETIAAATALGFAGWDTSDAKPIPVRWAYGFHLGGIPKEEQTRPDGMGRGSSQRTFGHFGQASCMAWADHDADLAVVFLCNRLLNELAVARRYAELSDAVWDALI